MNLLSNPFDIFPGSIPIGPDNRYRIPDQRDNQQVLRTILETQFTFTQSGQMLILSPGQKEKLVASANAPFENRPNDARVRRVFMGSVSVVDVSCSPKFGPGNRVQFLARSD